MEAGQKPTSNYQKTSISVVGDARFLMSWFIMKFETLILGGILTNIYT